MKYERTLIRLAMAYRNGTWRTRRLIRGRAEKLIFRQSLSLLSKAAIFAEWITLANATHIKLYDNF